MQSMKKRLKIIIIIMIILKYHFIFFIIFNLISLVAKLNVSDNKIKLIICVSSKRIQIEQTNIMSNMFTLIRIF